MIVAMEFEELYRKDGSYIDQGIVELRVRKFTSESVCKKNFMIYLEMSKVLVNLKLSKLLENKKPASVGAQVGQKVYNIKST